MYKFDAAGTEKWLASEIEGFTHTSQGAAIMQSLKAFLGGKKTYLLAGVSLLGILIAWSGGEMDNLHAIEAAVAAVMAMTFRAAIAKGPAAPAAE